MYQLPPDKRLHMENHHFLWDESRVSLWQFPSQTINVSRPLARGPNRDVAVAVVFHGYIDH